MRIIFARKGRKFSPFFYAGILNFTCTIKNLCYNKPIKRDNQEKEESMKKTFVVFMMIVAMAFGLIGCHDDSQPKELESVDGSSFLIVEYGVNYDIVYHKETKVMYIVSDGEHNRGNFTVMVNADGTPMIYKED